MSWGKVAAGVGVAVWSVIMVAVGKSWGNAEGEEDRQKMNAENEDLRRKLRSVLKTCEAEIAKKNQEIAWLETVIDQLTKTPPANRNELAERLRLMNLTSSQFELVMVHAAPIYGELR